jgi:hypothetical protein
MGTVCRHAPSGIAPQAKISVKPRKRWEKTVLYPLVTAGSGDFHGRNGDRSMTQGVHTEIAMGGISARDFARAGIQPRPSLGSSHALLLLSCP